MKYIVSFLVVLVLASCGGPISIDTKDVKGTIEADGAKLIKGYLKNDEGDLEQAIIQFDENCEISISPTSKSLDEIVSSAQRSDDAFGITRSEEVKENESVFYKENSNFAGTKTEGYRFFLLKKGKNKSYILKGSGKIFKPIPTKAEAEKAFKAAQSFKIDE